MIEGLIIWLDAEFITGLADGDKIATWPDRLGDYDATQVTDAKRPLYRPSVRAGRPALQFGGGQFMGIPQVLGNAAASALSIFVVALNTGSTGALVSTRVSTDGWTLRYNTTVQLAYFHVGKTPNITKTILNQTNILGFVRNGLDIYVLDQYNVGAPSWTTTSGFVVSGISQTLVGAEDNGTGSFLTGYIYELLVFGRAVNPIERDGIVNYLQSKYFTGV